MCTLHICNSCKQKVQQIKKHREKKKKRDVTVKYSGSHRFVAQRFPSLTFTFDIKIHFSLLLHFSFDIRSHWTICATSVWDGFLFLCSFFIASETNKMLCYEVLNDRQNVKIVARTFSTGTKKGTIRYEYMCKKRCRIKRNCVKNVLKIIRKFDWRLAVFYYIIV